MKIDLVAKIKRSEEIISHTIGNKSYILDPRNSTLRTLNETAEFIWNQTKNQTTVKKIVNKLCSAYEVTKETAEKDTLEFVKKYLEEKLLVKGNQTSSQSL